MPNWTPLRYLSAISSLECTNATRTATRTAGPESTGVHAVRRTLLVEDGSVVTMEPLAMLSIIPY